MKLFMDNVPTLAIQAPIARKLDEILCPTTVFRMPPDLVTKIAGESEEKVQEREKILSRLNTLEAGAQICRQYAMRPRPCEYTFVSYGLGNETNFLAATAPSNLPFGGTTFPSSSSSGTSVFGTGTPSKSVFDNAASSGSSSVPPGTGLFGNGTPSKGPKGLFTGAASGASSSSSSGTSLFGSVKWPAPSSQTSQNGFGSFGTSQKPSQSTFSTQAEAPKYTSGLFGGAPTSENTELVPVT